VFRCSEAVQARCCDIALGVTVPVGVGLGVGVALGEVVGFATGLPGPPVK